MGSLFDDIVHAIGLLCIGLIGGLIVLFFGLSFLGIPHEGQPTCIEDVVYDAQGKCVSRKLISLRRFLTMNSGTVTYLS